VVLSGLPGPAYGLQHVVPVHETEQLLRPNQILYGEVCSLELRMSDLELGRTHRDSHRERTIFSGTDHSGSLPDHLQHACGTNGLKSSRTTANGAEYQQWLSSLVYSQEPVKRSSGKPIGRRAAGAPVVSGETRRSRALRVA
jgi:hypothetical protein